MKATLEKLEDSRAILDVEVDLNHIEGALDMAYKRLVRKTDIPGFRKGKAPRAVLERHVGRTSLWREALDDLLGHAYTHAVEMIGIEPVADPEFDITRMEDGESLTFKASVDVRPEVRLGDYRSVRVGLDVAEVSEEEMGRFLDELRENQARLVTVEDGEAAPGHFLWISYEGTIGDKPVGSGGQSQLLEMGFSNLMPGLDEQLEGARAGEERKVTLTFPEDDEREELAGLEAILKIKVHSVARKETPDLDEEFARGTGYQGLEELKNEAKNKLRRAAREESERRALDEAIEAVVKQAEIGALPESMVERRLRHLMTDLEGRLRRIGLNEDAYLKQIGTDEAELLKQMKERAEREIKAELVLEQIAREEDIPVSDDEVKAGLEKAGLPPTAAPAIRGSLKITKAVDLLKESAIGDAELAS